MNSLMFMKFLLLHASDVAYISEEGVSLLPPAVATATFDLPTTLPAAVMAVILVSLTTVKLAASTPPTYYTCDTYT